MRNAEGGIAGGVTSAVTAKCQVLLPARSPGLWTDTRREGKPGGSEGLFLVFQECFRVLEEKGEN